MYYHTIKGKINQYIYNRIHYIIIYLDIKTHNIIYSKTKASKMKKLKYDIIKKKVMLYNMV